MKDLAEFNRHRLRLEQIRPFNFFLTATAVAWDENGKLLTRPVVAAFERDPEKWAGLNWAAKESSEPLRFGEADDNGIVWRLKTVGDFLGQYVGHTSPEWLDHNGRPCNPQTCGILTRRPIKDGDRYLLTKESLTWGDDPAHAFQTPQPAAFLEPGEIAVTPLLPAIKMIGPKAVADRLRLNMSTVTRWIAGKRRPEDIAPIERAIASLAGGFGLFSDHEIEHLNDAAITAVIQSGSRLRHSSMCS
jgi:hypothetical protein